MSEVRLRALEKDDLTFVHSLMNNPDIMDYWFSESHMSMERLKDEYDKEKDNDTMRQFILTNEKQEQLGFIGIYDIETRHRHAEFAIMMAPEHQGRGYATKATSLTVDYAFSTLNLHKLYLIVVETNEKAHHIYTKIGFKKEGELREHYYINGHYHDGILMCLLKNDKDNG